MNKKLFLFVEISTNYQFKEKDIKIIFIVSLIFQTYVLFRFFHFKLKQKFDICNILDDLSKSEVKSTFLTYKKNFIIRCLSFIIIITYLPNQTFDNHKKIERRICSQVYLILNKFTFHSVSQVTTIHSFFKREASDPDPKSTRINENRKNGKKGV